MLRSKRPGRSRAGSRSAARLVAPMTRMLAGTCCGLRRRRWAGSQALTASMNAPLSRSEIGVCSNDWSWISSSLTTPGMPSPWRGAGAPGAADGVELLDEPDGAALAPGVTAQRLEVGPDLAVGLAVEHRLEGRRRDEEERHAGLGGHGLGHVGLARPRRPLEQDGLAGRAAHLLGEGPVGQEQVEGLGHLLDQRLRPADVVEGHGELVGPVEDVRRAPGGQQRDHHHQDQHGDEDHGRQHGDRGRRGSGGWGRWPSGRTGRGGRAARRSGPAPWTGAATGCCGHAAGGRPRRWWPSGPHRRGPSAESDPVVGVVTARRRVPTGRTSPDPSDPTRSLLTMACLQLGIPGRLTTAPNLCPGPNRAVRTECPSVDFDHRLSGLQRTLRWWSLPTIDDLISVCSDRRTGCAAAVAE